MNSSTLRAAISVSMAYPPFDYGLLHSELGARKKLKSTLEGGARRGDVFTRGPQALGKCFAALLLDDRPAWAGLLHTTRQARVARRQTFPVGWRCPSRAVGRQKHPRICGGSENERFRHRQDSAQPRRALSSRAIMCLRNVLRGPTTAACAAQKTTATIEGSSKIDFQGAPVGSYWPR